MVLGKDQRALRRLFRAIWKKTHKPCVHGYDIRQVDCPDCSPALLKQLAEKREAKPNKKPTPKQEKPNVNGSAKDDKGPAKSNRKPRAKKSGARRAGSSSRSPRPSKG